MVKKNNYPLLLCSTCMAEYAEGGFKVRCDKGRGMILGQKCAFCGLHLPVYACRLEGKKRKK